MKVLKGFLRIFLVILAVILVFAIVIICTYVLGTPDTNTGTASRDIVSGMWVETISKDIDADLYTFDFNQSGDFRIYKGKKDNQELICDGWFKIDEKSQKIKMLMLPSHIYSEDYKKYVKFKVLSEVSYKNLKFQLSENPNNRTKYIEKDKEPTITFLIKPVDLKDDASEIDISNADTLILNCKMYEYTLDLYASEHDLTKGK